MSGQEFTPISYDTLIERFRELISRFVDGRVLIETRMRWGEQTADMIAPLVHRIRVFSLLHRSGSRMLENVMLAAVTNAVLPDMP